MPTTDDIASVIPAGVELTETQARAVLEVAAIAALVDRAVHRDEVGVLAKIATRLGVSMEADFKKLFDDLKNESGDALMRRLRAVRAHLDSDTARQTAYKAACAITAADLVETDSETVFHEDLAAALELPKEVSSRISTEVINTLFR